jgi:glutamine synthetase
MILSFLGAVLPASTGSRLYSLHFDQGLPQVMHLVGRSTSFLFHIVSPHEPCIRDKCAKLVVEKPLTAHFSVVQCEFRETDGSEADLCPRSTLRRVIQNAKIKSLEFLLGFEIEIVFMSRHCDTYVKPNFSFGHAWSSNRGLHSKYSRNLLEDIYDELSKNGIHLEQFHPESADGQFEFVLPALSPLEAVDTLLQAREIIIIVAADHGLRATLIPKPYPMQAGSASHAHISIVTSEGVEEVDATKTYESFYAGILKHLRSILAFSYSNPSSYDRMQDGCWAGGTWVAWGTQNRETALRKVDGSHWEIKVLDGLTNMYLAIAAFIAAGTKGVVDKERLLTRDCRIDPSLLPEKDRKALNIHWKLPKDLGEAMKALADDQVLTEALGERVIANYLSIKTSEWKLLEGMSDESRRTWIIERY